MKMTRKNTITLWALILCFAMVLPMLTACGGGGLELPTEEEIPTLTMEETLGEAPLQTAPQENVTAEETTTVDPSLNDPMWDYIPPENYIDYTDNEGLNSTQNIGGSGSMKVTGGNPMMSYQAYLQYLQDSYKASDFPASDRRKLAVEEMRAMLTLKWTPTVNTTYSYHPSAYYFTSGSKTSPIVNATNFASNQIHLEAGKVYQGLPYTLGSANATAFTYGLTAQNGIYTVPVNERNLSGASSGKNYNSEATHISARLGVNDSDAIFWAWAPVSSTIKFTDTASMTKANGVLSVGAYDWTKAATEAKSLAGQTGDIVSLNGNDKMLAAYGATQIADALVTNTEGKVSPAITALGEKVYVAEDNDDRILPADLAKAVRNALKESGVKETDTLYAAFNTFATSLEELPEDATNYKADGVQDDTDITEYNKAAKKPFDALSKAVLAALNEQERIQSAEKVLGKITDAEKASLTAKALGKALQAEKATKELGVAVWQMEKNHALLIADVVVTLTSDGKIDAEKSYVIALEQTDTALLAYEALSAEEKAAKKNEVLAIGGIDIKYTFAELLSDGYLPVTCKELTEDGAIEKLYYADYYREAASYTKSVLYTGYVYANRRIVVLNQIVTDKDGKEMINTSAFPTEMGVQTGKLYSYSLSVWDDASEAGRRYGDTSTSVLKSGETYRCVLKGLLATGEIVTFRDYEFKF